MISNLGRLSNLSLLILFEHKHEVIETKRSEFTGKKVVSPRWNIIWKSGMKKETKRSEFTGKKVVSPRWNIIWKSGMKKEKIINWYAIHLPWKLSLGNLYNVHVIKLANIYQFHFSNYIPTWRTTCFPVECSKHTWPPLKIQCYKAILSMEISKKW